MLTYGNINRKSRLLKYHIFDSLYEDALLNTEYSRYYESIKNIPGIEFYLAIRNGLHDAQINKLYADENINLELTLFSWDVNDNTDNCRKIIFEKGRIVSYNRVLRSGKITSLKKTVIPKTYLYDEIYTWKNIHYITIMMKPKNRIRTGIYFPLVTISFSAIVVMNL